MWEQKLHPFSLYMILMLFLGKRMMDLSVVTTSCQWTRNRTLCLNQERSQDGVDHEKGTACKVWYLFFAKAACRITRLVTLFLVTATCITVVWLITSVALCIRVNLPSSALATLEFREKTYHRDQQLNHAGHGWLESSPCSLRASFHIDPRCRVTLREETLQSEMTKIDKANVCTGNCKKTSQLEKWILRYTHYAHNMTRCLFKQPFDADPTSLRWPVCSAGQNQIGLFLHDMERCKHH